MYIVTFIDKVHGGSFEEFSDFPAAQEYWDSYADTPTCIFGEMKDGDTGEVIWEFSDVED